jgi:hypothetical protein
VVDRTGAKAFDTISVIRDDGAPTLARTIPSDTTAVAFDSTSLVFAWNALDVSGVKSVAIGGKTALRTGSVWSIRVDLAPGTNQFVAVAEDSLGNKSSDTVRIRRLPDTQGPKIASIDGLGGRLVAYDSASAPRGVDDLRRWWRQSRQHRRQFRQRIFGPLPSDGRAQAWTKFGSHRSRRQRRKHPPRFSHCGAAPRHGHPSGGCRRSHRSI